MLPGTVARCTTPRRPLHGTGTLCIENKSVAGPWPVWGHRPWLVYSVAGPWLVVAHIYCAGTTPSSAKRVACPRAPWRGAARRSPRFGPARMSTGHNHTRLASAPAPPASTKIENLVGCDFGSVLLLHPVSCVRLPGKLWGLEVWRNGTHPNYASRAPENDINLRGVAKPATDQPRTYFRYKACLRRAAGDGGSSCTQFLRYTACHCAWQQCLPLGLGLPLAVGLP